MSFFDTFFGRQQAMGHWDNVGAFGRLHTRTLPQMGCRVCEAEGWIPASTPITTTPWLIWMTVHEHPIASATDEEHAALIVRALNAWDEQVGGEYTAWYSPSTDPYDHHYDMRPSKGRRP